MDEEEAQFEGIWYKWCCLYCGEINEDENDIRGEQCSCENCGKTQLVSGGP